jgi:hypothetical protein
MIRTTYEAVIRGGPASNRRFDTRVNVLARYTIQADDDDEAAERAWSYARASGIKGVRRNNIRIRTVNARLA